MATVMNSRMSKMKKMSKFVSMRKIKHIARALTPGDS